jgi:Tat protein translocase TatB subunit
MEENRNAHGDVSVCASGAYAVVVFNVGPEKILLILLIALIVLGPRELPEAARKIGNILREVRRMSAGFEHELRSALDAATSDTSPPRTADRSVDAEPDSPSEVGESDSAA